MDRTILITGGTGFAGSHLVEALLAAGETNIHVTSVSDRPSFVHNLLDQDHIHKIDLTQQQDTQDLIAKIKPTQIYHLAALAAVGNSFSKSPEVIANNANLQISVLDAVKDQAPEAKVLVIGSAQEYDVIAHQTDSIKEDHPLGPSNPYGVSKVDQDLLALSYFYAHHLQIIRVRPFNHIGERQSEGFVVADFSKQIASIEQGNGETIKVGNLSAIRDFSDVKDVVQAYILIMNQGQIGEVYNVGSGNGYAVQELLDTLVSLAKVPITVEKDESRYRPIDVAKIIANNDKLSSLGWKPIHQIPETLERTLNDWRTRLSPPA